MRILVVEDERAVRDALERVLRTDGYEVELAGDGHAALAALSEREQDAVVLDVMLPLVDGLEVCRELRARVRALLRRASGGGGEPLQFGDLVLDPRAHLVHRGDRRIELTMTEF